MIKTVRLPTEFGPLETEIIWCDRSDCGERVHPSLAVGWLVVAKVGVDVPSMGGLFTDSETHFCGKEHLKEYLS